MSVDNHEIVKALQLYASLAELHEENPFKYKAFASGAFNLRKIKEPLSDLQESQLISIPGVGKSVAKAIAEYSVSRRFPALEELLSVTPQGLIAMLGVKGLGPKKVRLIWQELGIDTVEDLFDACRQNRLVEVSGFGYKTQQTIMAAIEFSFGARGKFHLARVMPYAESFLAGLRSVFADERHEFSGDYYRKSDVIEKLVLLTTAMEMSGVSALEWEAIAADGGLALQGWTMNEETGFLTHEQGFVAEIEVVMHSDFDRMLFEGGAAARHLEMIGYRSEDWKGNDRDTYAAKGVNFVVPSRREGHRELERPIEEASLLKYSDIKGVLHNHTTYSDGLNSLEEMALYAMEIGMEYLGVCDHSKSAGYARGLQVERVLQQFEEIEILNQQLWPFKIFKGIESDILGNGELDYEPEILKQFDIIVASVHSNLNMSQEKAMDRLIKAIENPYTTILGHPTGRLLLMREGYPLDHSKIIDACAANGVAIELNANPYRLDIDWRYIDYAMEKGVMVSVNPDAHEKMGYLDMHFGVLSGQKGGLQTSQTLNALNLVEFEAYLANRKK
ncbi:MAG: DNA polymerase/3'-5' exonuclease PolX [Bacteroidetes bacterium]|nr:DNA polymerase/3'-5' exonuclease PolX [Bacteroidota bacterium]